MSGTLEMALPIPGPVAPARAMATAALPVAWAVASGVMLCLASRRSTSGPSPPWP